MSDRSGDMTSAFATALEAAETSSSAAPPAAAPATTPATEPAAPAATTQAAAEPSVPVSVTTETPKEEQKGEPPAWRWQDILANARKTTAEETEARLRQEYAWTQDFQGVSPEERAGLLIVRRALSGDAAAQAQIRARAQTDPAVAAAFSGLLPQPTATPSQEPEPELFTQNPDGTVTYSPAQVAKWKDWLTTQLRAGLQDELKPYAEEREHRIRADAKAHAFSEVAAVLTTFRADPEFVAHETAIRAEIEKDAALQRLSNEDPGLALETAWGRIWKRDVLPRKQQQTTSSAEAAVLTNLQRSAVASAVHPAAPSPTAPKTFRPSQEGFAEALAHFSGAEAR